MRIDFRLPILLLATSSPLAAQLAPPIDPPAELRALHRSGQTFLTWNESSAVEGERYFVWRSSAPPGIHGFASAELLAELPEGSGRFHADRYRVAPGEDVWEPRYLERYVVEDGGEELPEGTGLFVWTPSSEDLFGAEEGEAWYAVTAALPGQSAPTWQGGPLVAGPVAESVAEPAPVHVSTSPDGVAHLFVQYLDLRRFNPTLHAPGPIRGWYGLDPEAPGVAGGLQYAFTYIVAEPDPARHGTAPTGPLPVVLLLHGHGDGVYPPDLSPAHNGFPALEIRPIDVHETWWFGFAADHDYRTGELPGDDAVVENYTESRVLRMVRDLLRDDELGPRADPERVYVYGASMGGTGTLSLSSRYPHVFAAAYASIPMTDHGANGIDGLFGPELVPLWGTPEQSLPVELSGPARWADELAVHDGTPVWAWQDLVDDLVRREGEETAPLGVAHGLRDPVVDWQLQGAPYQVALDAARRAWGGALVDVGHLWTDFAGLPPALDRDASGYPFHGLRAVRGETVPGLSNASGNPELPPDGPGSVHDAILWSSSWDPWDGAPVDALGEWGISLRTVDGEEQTVDVTPRRTLFFRPDPGDRFELEVRSAVDGELLRLGTAQADELGLVTATEVPVHPDGVRVRLRRIQYELHVPDLVAGGVSTFGVSGADPGAPQWLAIGSTGTGATPVPELGLLLDLDSAVLLGSFTADDQGTGALTTDVPAELDGHQLGFQAFQLAGTTPAVHVFVRTP